eukprot:6480662-Lingulodinium_polyedra.AAC.1
MAALLHAKWMASRPHLLRLRKMVMASPPWRNTARGAPMLRTCFATQTTVASRPPDSTESDHRPTRNRHDNILLSKTH